MLFPRALCFWMLLMAVTPAAWPGTKDKALSKYKVLYSFKGRSDGGGVFGGVALDAKGNVYGVTRGGGAYERGTVFELIRGAGGTWSETILHAFCPDFPKCDDGAGPEGTLVFDANGNFYGVSHVTFEMSPDADGWTFHVICDCIVPSVSDAAGNIYGIGGPGKHGAGAVSELSPTRAGWTGAPRYTSLYSFCSKDPECQDGEPPEWAPVFDSAGNLYGTTELGGNAAPGWCLGSGGCGVAYQLESLGNGKWKHHLLHRFAAYKNDGQLPYAGVTVDAAGNVFGTTLEGGRTQSGTIFEIARQPDGSWKETVLYDFPGYPKNGAGPAGGMAFDNARNLYGTTSGGGDPDCRCGVVFRLSPQANGKWKYTVLHRFHGRSDGWSPQANVVFDKNYRHLYGTTVEGGPGGYGVVFEITP